MPFIVGPEEYLDQQQSETAAPAPPASQSPPDVRALVRSTAEAHGVDPDVIEKIARTESTLDQKAVSPKGAIGVMQLMPDTAKGLGVDPHDLRDNIEGGVRYYKSLLDQYGGDAAKAAAAYNAGPTRVAQAGPLPQETQNFVEKVSNPPITPGAQSPFAVSPEDFLAQPDPSAPLSPALTNGQSPFSVSPEDFLAQPDSTGAAAPPATPPQSIPQPVSPTGPRTLAQQLGDILPSLPSTKSPIVSPAVAAATHWPAGVTPAQPLATPAPALPAGLPTPTDYKPGDELPEVNAGDVVPYWQNSAQNKLAGQYNQQLDAWKTANQAQQAFQQEGAAIGKGNPPIQEPVPTPSIMDAIPDVLKQSLIPQIPTGPLDSALPFSIGGVSVPMSVVKGFVNGVTQQVTPLNVAAGLATGGATAAIASAGRVGAAIGTGLEGAFAAGAAYGAGDNLKQAYDAFEQGDLNSAGEHLGLGGVDGLFAALLGRAVFRDMPAVATDIQKTWDAWKNSGGGPKTPPPGGPTPIGTIDVTPSPLPKAPETPPEPPVSTIDTTPSPLPKPPELPGETGAGATPEEPPTPQPPPSPSQQIAQVNPKTGEVTFVETQTGQIDPHQGTGLLDDILDAHHDLLGRIADQHQNGATPLLDEITGLSRPGAEPPVPSALMPFDEATARALNGGKLPDWWKPEMGEPAAETGPTPPETPSGPSQYASPGMTGPRNAGPEPPSAAEVQPPKTIPSPEQGQQNQPGGAGLPAETTAESVPPSTTTPPPGGFPGSPYALAVQLAQDQGKLSTSTLQRNLRLGYGAASKLLDTLSADGVVGPANGTLPRPFLKAPGASSTPGEPGTSSTPGQPEQPASKETPPSPSAAPAPPSAPHDYASTQVNLPAAIADQVRSFASRIPDTELSEKGREDEPHVTVKYGLHGDDPAPVQKLLEGLPPITVTLGKASVFHTDDGDVLKVGVSSPDLHRLDAQIADALPHTDTFPTYQPHVTVAYLKPGEGDKYDGQALPGITGQTITLHSVTFSQKGGAQVQIPLTGGTSAPSAGTEAPLPPPHTQTLNDFRKRPDALNVPKDSALGVNPDEETPESLQRFSKPPLQVLAQVSGAAQSGTKNEIAARIARTWQTRKELANETVESLESRPGKDLRPYLDDLGLFKGGNKHSQAVSIINWRDKVRAEAKQYVAKGNWLNHIRRAVANGEPIPEEVQQDLKARGNEWALKASETEAAPPEKEAAPAATQTTPAVEQPQSAAASPEERKPESQISGQSADSIGAPPAPEERKPESQISAQAPPVPEPVPPVTAPVSPVAPDLLAVTGKKTYFHRNQIKRVPGAKWDKEEKAWLLPDTEASKAAVKAISRDLGTRPFSPVAAPAAPVPESPAPKSEPLDGRTTPPLGTPTRDKMEADYKTATAAYEAAHEKERAADIEVQRARYGTKKKEAAQKKRTQLQDAARALLNAAEALRKPVYRGALEDAAEQTVNPVFQIAARQKLADMDEQARREAPGAGPVSNEHHQALHKAREQATAAVIEALLARVPELDAHPLYQSTAHEIEVLDLAENRDAIAAAVKSFAEEIIEHPHGAEDVDKNLTGRLHAERVRQYKLKATAEVDAEEKRWREATGVAEGGDRQFKDARNSIASAYEVPDIDRQVANVKAFVAIDLDKKQAEIRIKAADRKALSEAVRPISTMPVPRSNEDDSPSKVWKGNAVEGGTLLSDGAMMIDSTAIQDKQRVTALRAKGDHEKTYPEASIRTGAWDKYIGEADKPLEEIGHVADPKHDNFDVAIFTLPNGDIIPLSAKRVRFIQHITGATAARGSTALKPVVFYRDGKPVALLSPRRDAPDIDLAIARKAAGVTGQSADSIGAPPAPEERKPESQISAQAPPVPEPVPPVTAPVSPVAPDLLAVTGKKTYFHRNQIKRVPGAKWDKEEKAWLLPDTEASKAAVKAISRDLGTRPFSPVAAPAAPVPESPAPKSEPLDGRTTPPLGTPTRDKMEADYKTATAAYEAAHEKERAADIEVQRARYGTKKKEAAQKKRTQLQDAARALLNAAEALRKPVYRGALEDAAEQTVNPVFQIAARQKLADMDEQARREAPGAGPVSNEHHQALHKAREQATAAVIEALLARVPELDAHPLYQSTAHEIEVLDLAENRDAIAAAVKSFAEEIIEHPHGAEDVDKNLTGRLHAERVRQYKLKATAEVDAEEKRWREATGVAEGGDRQFKDARNSIASAYEVPDIDRQVANVKAFVAIDLDKKQAEIRIKAADRKALSEAVRPISTMPVPRSNEDDSPSKVWKGNAVEGGTLLSDGAMMIDSTAIQDKQRVTALRAKGDHEKTYPEASIRTGAWDKYIGEADKPLEEIGHVADPKHDNFDVAIFTLPNGDIIPLSAKRVRFIQHITGATAARGSTALKPVVFYRDGKPVALLSPRRDAPDIDLAIARKAAGVTGQSADSIGAPPAPEERKPESQISAQAPPVPEPVPPVTAPVSPVAPDLLAVTGKKTYFHRNQIKRIPGARWNPDEKVWTIPNTKAAMDAVTRISRRDLGWNAYKSKTAAPAAGKDTAAPSPTATTAGLGENKPEAPPVPAEEPTVKEAHAEPAAQTEPARETGSAAPAGELPHPVPGPGEEPHAGEHGPQDVSGVRPPDVRPDVSEETAPRPGGGTLLSGSVPPERGGVASSGRKPKPPKPTHDRDYKLTEADHLGEGNIRAKAQANVAAIRILKACQAENRQAIPEEQSALAKYTGWGASELSKVFGENYYVPQNLKPIREALDQLLTPEEFKAARASTVNAHYTSSTVVKAMWDAMRHLGMQGGERVLEPAMGVGNFFGLEPADLLKNSARTGIELDTVTGGIAKLLYPDSNVHIGGFQEVPLANDFFDVAIGNVPFANHGVNDPDFRDRPQMTRSIHNYFFAKALDKVRDGGVVAFITSSHTMDSLDPGVRKYLSEHADLLGAIRLPHNAFSENAGTQVTTDVIFLRKRPAGTPYAGEPWTGTAEMLAPDKRTNYSTGQQTIPINEYYAAHPGMMLGKMIVRQGQGGRQVNALEGNVSAENLAEAIAKLPAGVLQERPVTRENLDARIPLSDLPDPSVVKDGGFVVQTTSPGGKVHHALMIRQGNELKPAELSDNAARRVRGMLTVRDAWRNVLQAQEGDDDKAATKARKLLNTAYDSFVKMHGPLSNRDNARDFRGDPDAPGLLGLEDFDPKTKTAKKTDIFRKSTNTRYTPPESAPDAASALAIALNEFGGINWPRIQKLTGLDRDAAERELIDNGLVYKNPEGAAYETADQYLSGNVREKLKSAIAATESDPSYEPNVEALKRVQPEDLLPGDIDARLGAGWIPKEDIGQFLNEKLGVTRIRIGHSHLIASWSVNADGNVGNAANQSEYGMHGFSGVDLVELAMNLKMPTVRVPGDTEGSTVVDPVATAAVREKQQKLKDLFRKWIWEDPDRATRLARLYNDSYNNLRLREFDGSHLKLPGADPSIKLRPHQLNAIWRMLQGGNALLAHVVGAGKTFSVVGAAMEMRRLGTAKKPMIVVPNHLVQQWRSEFLRLYPTANLFVADKDTFSTGNRQQAMSRIANGNFDAVIVSHSSFGKLPVSDATFKAWMDEQVKDLEDAIYEAKAAEGENGPTVKDLEKAKRRLEAKLQKRLKREKKDKTITFEEMGIDQMFVDEAHAYKALFFSTKMGRVAGIPNRESDRAIDMFLKTQWITRKRGGTGVVFATGTPISNTMAEMYTMMRYLQNEQLRQTGLAHFDAWAAQYGEGVTSLELAPQGGGYRMNTRFARFVNLPELATAFRVSADVQTAEMLKLPTPKIKGGKPVTVVAKSSKQQKALIGDDKTPGSLVYRAANLPKGPPKKGNDNMLAITGDGRKGALDMRLVNPGAGDYPDGKTNMAVDKLHNIWKRTSDTKATQLVFCDLSTPKPEGGGFSVYNDMRDKLIARGIPAEEIAFIHDYDTDEKKKKLFDAVNDGRIRILFGSTEKMGAGMNVQKRLVALHHLDAPWRPSDIEQREGRILRQGNTNEEVEIYRYVTEGSFDAYIWQLLENKARFIAQVMRGKSGVRTAEDVEGAALTYAEIKGIASGSPEVIEKIKTDIEVRRLDALRSEYENQLFKMRSQAAGAPRAGEQLRVSLEQSEEDLALRNNAPDQLWHIGDETFEGKDANARAGAKIHELLQAEADKTLAALKSLDAEYAPRAQELSQRLDAAQIAAEAEGEAYVHGSKAAHKRLQDEAQAFRSEYYNAKRTITDNAKTVPLGTYRGFELRTSTAPRTVVNDEHGLAKLVHLPDITVKGSKQYRASTNQEGNPAGTLASIRYHIEDIDTDVKNISESIENLDAQGKALRELIARPFEHAERLKELLKRQAELNNKLDLNKATAGTEGQEQEKPPEEPEKEPDPDDDAGDNSPSYVDPAAPREEPTGKRGEKSWTGDKSSSLRFALGIPSAIAGVADSGLLPKAVYRHGILWVNHRTMGHLFPEGGHAKGVYVPPGAATELLRKAESPQPGRGGSIQQALFKAVFKAVSGPMKKAIAEAAGDGHHGVVVVRYDKGQSLQDVRESIRHELFHRTEQWGGDTAGRILLQDPLAQKAAAMLGRRGYDPTDHAMMWSEIGAHLAGGPNNWAGLGLTREEAKQLFARYLQLLPDGTIEKLERIAPQLNEELYAERAFRATQRAARERAAPVRFSRGPENQTSQGSPEEGELRPGVRQDVSPRFARGTRQAVTHALQNVAAGTPLVDSIVETWESARDDLRKNLSPYALGQPAKVAGLSLREHAAQAAQSFARAEKALEEARKLFTTQTWDENLKFINRVETGATQPTPALQAIADTMRQLLDSHRIAVQQLGKNKLTQFYVNYFPHLWKRNQEAESIFRAIFGKRPIEGTKSFLQQRKFKSFQEGVDKGLVPVSENPVDLVLLKLKEMERYTLAHTFLNEMKGNGLARYYNVGTKKKPPEGWVKLPDPIGAVWGPPTITIPEAHDKQFIDTLLQLAKDLGVNAVRVAKLRGAWGRSYQGADKIKTRFAGPESVILHELGHQIDEKWNLQNQIVNDPEFKKELSKLADLRLVSGSSAYYQKYVRKGEEKIANMIAAYGHAPERFKQVAPKTYRWFKDFISKNPELEPLNQLRYGMQLEVHHTEYPIGGFVQRGNYWMPSGAAQLISNYLSPGLGNKAWYKALRSTSNLMLQFALGFSGFHAGFTVMDSAVSKLAIALQYAADGKSVEALKHGNPLAIAAAPIKNIVRGGKIRDAYLSSAVKDPELVKYVDAIVQGGGRVTMDAQYRTNMRQAFMDAWRKHNVGTVALTGIPALAEAAVWPVLEWLVPRMKLGVFADMVDFELQRMGPNASQQQVRDAFAGAWDSVDNRMGQLVYDDMFWNRTVKDLTMIAVQSVGWNLGTFRELGGAAKDVGHFAADIGGGIIGGGKGGRGGSGGGIGSESPGPGGSTPHPGNPRFTRRMAYALALITLTGLIGSVIDYVNTKGRRRPDGSIDDGHERNWKDYFFPRTGNVDEQGHEERMLLPGYLKDLVGWYMEPTSFARNKLSPIVRFWAETLFNRNWENQKIWDGDNRTAQENGIEELKHFGSFFLPISVSGFLQEKDRGAGKGIQAGQFLGVRTAPAYITRTPAERYMQQYADEHREATSSPTEASQIERDITKALRAGDEDRAMDIAEKAGAEGKLTDKQFNHALKMAQTDTLVSQFERLPILNAIDAAGLMNAQERAKAMPLLDKKFQSALKTAPAAEVQRIMDRLDRANLQ